MDTVQRLWDLLEVWCEMPTEQAQPDLLLASVGLDVATLRFDIDENLQHEFRIGSLGLSILQVQTVGDLAKLIDARIGRA